MRKDEEMIEAIMNIARDDAPKVQEGISAIGRNMFEKGMMPKDAMGISDADAENMYAQGYQLYNMGKYKDARHMFTTLSMMDSTEPKYIFGMAASLHMEEKYEAAAKAYLQMAFLSAEDPVPYYHAADCYLKLDETLSALTVLKQAAKRCGSKPEYALMKERVDMTIANLEADIQAELEGAP
ncbi:MAG: SycD/LcrH family type III secretion system chaperone, partial [Chlamydiia bacterium]|nr:SycD/LcrH family type III secretion system chaperone [Chlamydiia bacterium]